MCLGIQRQDVELLVETIHLLVELGAGCRWRAASATHRIHRDSVLFKQRGEKTGPLPPSFDSYRCHQFSVRMLQYLTCRYSENLIFILSEVRIWPT